MKPSLTFRTGRMPKHPRTRSPGRWLAWVLLLLVGCNGFAASTFPSRAAHYEITEGHVPVRNSFQGSQAIDPGISTEFDSYQVREDDRAVRIAVFRSSDDDSLGVIRYETRDDTGRAGQDYVRTTGVLEFIPGERAKYIIVPILNDSQREENERFWMSFSWLDGGKAVPITILDNETHPGVQFEKAFDWQVKNGASLTLRVFRNDDAHLGAFTVKYATHDGSALAGQHYKNTHGVLAFGEGELVKSVTVPIINDGDKEWDAEFTVSLSDPSGSVRLGPTTSITVRIVQPFTRLPLVQEAIGQVQSSDLLSLMRQITGEVPVLVGGEVGAITNRNTRSGVPIRWATQFAWERMQSLGLQVYFQEWETQDWNLNPISNRNVVGVQPGRGHSNEIIVVAAHLDGMPEEGWAPGADDNASGSAAVLEVARVLSQFQFARTLHFVLFTGEEQGLLGSRHYTAHAKSGGSNIVATLVLDMIANPRPGTTNAILEGRLGSGTFVIPNDPARYPNDWSIASTFTNVVATTEIAKRLHPLIIQHRGDSWGMPNSDYWPFWDAGYLAIRVYDGGGAPIHSTDDTLESLDWEYFSAMVEAIVGTTAQLAHPVGGNPLDILEVVNSDWTLGSGIGGGVFLAKHEADAMEMDDDLRDLPWAKMPIHPTAKWLKIFTDPDGVEMQTDSRPSSSETIYRGKLSVVDTTGAGVSCRNRLRFSFIAPPESNRVYLAHIRVGGEAGFDRVIDVRDVVAAGGFVDLPSLVGVPDGMVYGTCDIAARFLETSPKSYRLRISGVGERTVSLLATAQMGTHIIDDLEVRTSLSGTMDWTHVQSFTNYVSPDVAHFEAGWTEIPRDIATEWLPAAEAQYFRLKRTWIRPQ